MPLSEPFSPPVNFHSGDMSILRISWYLDGFLFDFQQPNQKISVSYIPLWQFRKKSQKNHPIMTSETKKKTNLIPPVLVSFGTAGLGGCMAWVVSKL